MRFFRYLTYVDHQHCVIVVSEGADVFLDSQLQEAELLASTGRTGDSYGNAMAESINGRMHPVNSYFHKNFRR